SARGHATAKLLNHRRGIAVAAVPCASVHVRERGGIQPCQAIEDRLGIGEMGPRIGKASLPSESESKSLTRFDEIAFGDRREVAAALREDVAREQCPGRAVEEI